MKWIICFSEAKNSGIWKIFTRNRPQFGHVFAVCYDVDLDTWYKFEFATQRFNFSWNRHEEADYLIGDMVVNCRCVEIESQANSIPLPRWLYCVSFIKHVVGIRKPWILTPYQLYCELHKLGGKEIFLNTKGD